MLKEVREKIDILDGVLIEALAQRKDLVKEIADIKKKNSISIADEKRENEIFKKRRRLAKEVGLNQEYVEQLFLLIIKNSREEQKNHTL